MDKRQNVKTIKKRGPNNGRSFHNLYHVWEGVRQRCNDPKKDKYRYYGGRGISVCKQWDSFANFLYDMGERPVGTSLDRIDPNGNYCPENCRWATKIEQANNTRSNRILVIHGEQITLSQAARKWNIGLSALFRRLQLGWNVDDAVRIPVGCKRLAKRDTDPQAGAE